VKISIAYIEESPFGWTDSGQTVTGADVELAQAVLRAVGVTDIKCHMTTFSELLPGVEAGRWDMTVPPFVAPERSGRVAFSLPVWSVVDGFLVRANNPETLVSYSLLAERGDALLGIIAGQVQRGSARMEGVKDEQITTFERQSDAVDALL
jgi:polar amino acid transport system substrate-binding protein